MNVRIAMLLAVVSLAHVATSSAQERMTMIPADKMTVEQKKAVADYKALRAKFGEPGIVEIASIQGYYAYLAMVMNAARITVAPGVTPQLERFPRLGK